MNQFTDPSFAVQCKILGIIVAEGILISVIIAGIIVGTYAVIKLL